MSLHVELHKAFSSFLDTIKKDNETDVLVMPYAEFSLQFFVIYHDLFYTDILRESGPLAQAFCQIGIVEPRDQLCIFLEHFYIYLRTNQEVS